MTDASTDDPHAFPRTVECGGEAVELRLMGPGDRDAVLAFARTVPEHDLLFLRRDITQPKVVEAWLRDIEGGAIVSPLAWMGGDVVGCAALVRDPLSWSAHVLELRVVVGAAARGRGLGAVLAQEAFVLGLKSGCEKMFAQMTVDQPAAVALFEGLGFAPEAMLRDHVKDRSGQTFDVVVLSHRVEQMRARLQAYGMDFEG